MKIITRFAPSPTGFLHVGNIRMALINYLLSRKHKGKFILRIDDTDYERSKEKYILSIKEDLKWLNLEWDLEFKQSDNISIYQKYLKILKEKEYIYPCYESKEELEFKRKLQLSRGAPPIYDRAALKLTDKQKQSIENEGKRPHYRLKLEHTPIEWVDLIKGNIKINGNSLSDPILVKDNGIFLYTFSSVVDDIEHQITHIIRGEDHLSNTAIQIQIFNYLGFKTPEFGHMSLLSMLDGEQLSKRQGSSSIKDLRLEGIYYLSLLNYLFMLGKSEQKKLYLSLEDIIRNFDLQSYSKSAVKFDINKLYQINSLILQNLNFANVEKNLLELGINNITKNIWDLYKYNIKSLLDISKYHNILHGQVYVKASNKVIIELALKFIPSEEFTEANIDIWINNIVKNADVKKKEVFLLLRRVLTSSISGPGFKEIILAIGQQKIKERLLLSLQE